MMMPKVSIIIPAYNSARFIGETLRSVLAQTCRDFEIIVVDDGSTDDTAAVAQSYGDQIHYVRQENRGPSAARNVGLHLAQGEFVGLLDADDLWEPDFLATLVPILDADQGLGAVYCGWRHIDESGNPLPQLSRPRDIPSGCFRNELIWGNFLSIHTVLVRTDCYAKVGLFDESLERAEDWDMWLRISEQYRFRSVPFILAKYRLHHQTRSSGADATARGILQIVAKHFGTGAGDAVRWSSTKRHAYGGGYFRSSASFFEEGDSTTGRDYVRRAFSVSPELMQRFSTFYELACACQPRGLRGDFAHLDLGQTCRHTLDSLDFVFSDPVSSNLAQHRSRAYGSAYLALGLLAYGSSHLAHARRFLLKAIQYDPHIISHPEVVPKLAKACLPNPWLEYLRGLRKATA